ncbi:hypothetical protein BDN72DRAFT_901581 [Pluteus cervinus]|uniref:Uncharacterized protein n=1 Tax=Pluteus cervinus TaxID=181527 RepID=A0ACD3AGL8_9AGAR|nr:hypothetical protein BDN72DRAFT_901581 [Pluteus cervinus]
MATHFSVPIHLHRFFPGSLYDDFRLVQARTGAVIFGSVALDVFTRTYNDSSTLDITVTFLAYGELANWLEDHSYMYQKPRPGVDADDSNVVDAEDDDVCSDTDSSSNGTEAYHPPDVAKYVNGIRIIHVWVARNTTLENVIGSNLTCTMNFITANDAISLYPHSTFHLGQALRLRHIYGDPTDIFIDKYRGLGWSVIDEVPAADRARKHDDFYAVQDRSGVRFVGDSKCWILPCVPSSRLLEFTLFRHINSWNIEFTPRGACSRFTVVKSEDLRERYLVSQDRELGHFIRKAIYDTRDQIHDRAVLYIQEHFNLQTALSLYFSDTDVEGFMVFLRETHSAIIGSTSFHFFDRSLTSDVPLEVLVDDGDAPSITHWLKMSDYSPGTTTTFSPDDYGVSLVGIEVDVDITDFFDTKDRLVRVISATVSPTDFVLRSKCTSVMGIISAHGARFFYPHSTFDERTALRIHNSVLEVNFATPDFFSDNGLTVCDNLSSTHRTDALSDFEVGGRRYVGDHKTWSLGVPLGFPRSESSSWKLTYHDDKAYTRVTSSFSMSYSDIDSSDQDQDDSDSSECRST